MATGTNGTVSLASVEQEVAAKQAEIKGIQDTFNDYSNGVNASIRDILTEAGVFDAVHELETERYDVQRKAQAKADVLIAEIKDLEKVHQYLVRHGVTKNGATTAPADDPSEEIADEPTSDVMAAADAETVPSDSEATELKEAVAEVVKEVVPAVVEAAKAEAPSEELLKKVAKKAPSRPTPPSF